MERPSHVTILVDCDAGCKQPIRLRLPVGWEPHEDHFHMTTTERGERLVQLAYRAHHAGVH